jgi:hypothetical protein
MTTTELAPVEHQHTATLFAGATPGDVIGAAADAANALSDVIRQKHLYQKIGGREHVLVEGWQACGTLVGVFAVKDGGVRELPWPELDDDTPGLEKLRAAHSHGQSFGFTAAYRAVKDGQEVGWGEGRCTRGETNWRGRDDYALSSMAQTRGQSRALRQPLGFIVSLAGYATTPAEEVSDVVEAHPYGKLADEKLTQQAAIAVQHVLPSVDGFEFVRMLSRTFDDGLPEAAARTLKGLEWWMRQPQATGNTSQTPQDAAAGDPGTDPEE